MRKQGGQMACPLHRHCSADVLMCGWCFGGGVGNWQCCNWLLSDGQIPHCLALEWC